MLSTSRELRTPLSSQVGLGGSALLTTGGKIFVFTGILPVAENDDGLAVVLGHEVAHVVARHGAERMSSMKVLFGVSFLLETLGLDVGLTRLLVTLMMQWVSWFDYVLIQTPQLPHEREGGRHNRPAADRSGMLQPERGAEVSHSCSCI